MWGQTEFKIHEEIMELFFDQAIFSRGVISIEIFMEPSTKPSLLFTSNAIRIALAQVG